MHEAIIRKKTTFLTRNYSSGRHRFEDPITSLIFGGLQYVPAHDSFTFFSHYFESKPPKFKAEKVTLHFWKRFRRTSPWVAPNKWDALNNSIAEIHSIEPDLVIKYTGPQDRNRYYLIEVKWDSPESDNELLKQWEILSDSIQAETCHIFLVKRKPSSTSRPEATVCLWSRLVSELQSPPLKDASSQFETWRNQTVKVLMALVPNSYPFSGFSNLNLQLSMPTWTFQAFDASVLMDCCKDIIQEQNMASETGAAIMQAVDSISAVWKEVSAMEREVNALLVKALGDAVKEPEGQNWDSAMDEQSNGVCVKYAWWYNFPRKRGKRLFCVAFCVVLLRDKEEFPGMDEPIIIAALGEEGGEFDIGGFGWQEAPESLNEDQKAEVELIYEGKLQKWYGCDAYFAAPLTAIKNRGDIETQLVDPLAAQILLRLEENKGNSGNVEDCQVKTAGTFSAASELLTFELYRNGVRRISQS